MKSTARDPRPYVTVPDGRVFYGSWPDAIAPNSETPYVIALAEQLGGVCEVVLPIGRADVVSAELAIEVESVSGWRAGARQAYGYAGQTGLPAAIALFGQANYAEIYRKIRDELPGMHLWIWSGQRFEHCTSLRLAKRLSPTPKKPAAVVAFETHRRVTKERAAAAAERLAATPVQPEPRAADGEIGPYACPHDGVHATENEALTCKLVLAAPPFTIDQERRIFAAVAPAVERVRQKSLADVPVAELARRAAAAAPPVSDEQLERITRALGPAVRRAEVDAPTV